MKRSNSKITPPVSIFKNTLNLYQFLLVTPYFITYCNNQERAILRYSNTIVKVAFIVIQALTVVFMCWRAFKQFGISQSLDAVPIMALSHVAWIVLNIIVIDFIWRRTSHTLDMMNLLSDIYQKCTQFDLKGRTVEWITKIPWFLGLFGIFWVLLDVVMLLRCNDKTPLGMHKSIIDSAYSEYFNLNNFSRINAEDYSTIQSNLLGAIYVVLIICMDGLTRCCYMACVCGGLGFWLTVNAFLNHIQLQDVHKRLPEVLEILDQIQLALSHASDSLGLLYLMICVAFLPYYCLALPILFGGHVLRVLEVVFYCIAFALATIPAAYAHSLLKSIVPLIKMSYTGANASFLSNDINMRVNIAIHMLHADTFALSGKVFVITYGFIGSICGLVVTFAVLLSNVTFKTKFGKVCKCLQKFAAKRMT